MPIIINNFQRGQSSSPYLGDGAFSKSANLDIWGQEGIARINYKPTAATGTLGGIPIHSAGYSGEDHYIALSDNNVWLYDISEGSLTIKSSAGNAGHFITYWESYLLGSKINNLTYYAGSGTTWTNHLTLGGQWNNKPFYSTWDGKIYIPQGKFIGRLSKVGTFDPSNSDTYSWTGTAFTLPADHTAISINELGNYLVIAAIPVNIASIASSKETMYFFWDRSATTPDYIYHLGELGMFNMFKFGEVLFVSGGMSGRIYTLTTSGLEFYTQIPFDYDNAKRISINSDVYSGASSLSNGNLCWWNGQLIAGVTSLEGLTPAGIYGIKGKRASNLFTISSGEDGTNDTYIGFVQVISDEHLFYGWKTVVGETTSYGVDIIKNSNNRTTSYGSYFESLLYPVGTKTDKKSFNKVEVQLSRPLQTGEAVRIKYRQDISSSWTTLDTQDYATYGATTNLDFPGIHNLENVQIRIELTTGSASANTPYLKEIRLLD